MLLHLQANQQQNLAFWLRRLLAHDPIRRHAPQCPTGEPADVMATIILRKIGNCVIGVIATVPTPTGDLLWSSGGPFK
jgi:hypothetical protein